MGWKKDEVESKEFPVTFRVDPDDNKALVETLVWDVLESITDAIVTIDGNHRVVMCNKAAEEMFGYGSTEMIGNDLSFLIPEPHHEVHRGYVDRYIDSGVARVIGKSRECMIMSRSGRRFPVEISYSVSKTRGRFYFTAVIRDITTRKDLEKEFRFMEKLAAVGKAVAHVVHEIRKPLMLIGGFARQVEHCEALKADEKDRHKLRIIVEEVRRLETLLNGIRLVTRPTGARQMRSISLNRILRESIELLDPMLQKNQVSLTTELSPNPLMVQADPDQLKQVFLNLLQNAIEALGDEGIVRVGSTESLTHARVVIEDNGPGIPEELQDKIFDSFFTTKSAGTGLGLPISRSIIQEHGGTLVIDSKPSQGTRLSIELPLDFP